MKTLSVSTLVAVLFGLLAYMAIRLLWPGVAVQHFTNVIGVVALLGAAVGAAVGTWWTRRSASALPPQNSQPSAKRKRGRHD